MMTKHVHTILLLSLAVLSQPPSRSFADCAPFYVSLNDMDSITEKGGYVSCPVSFAPGVNDNGVVFDGNCYITFPNPIFDADAGSVSFWFRNDSPGIHRGLFQIGMVGEPTSAGASHDGNTVCFQMRDDNGEWGMCFGSAPTGWNHVVCMWDLRDDDRHDMWLFIDGIWADSDNLPGAYTQTAGQLEIGCTTYHVCLVGMMDELRFFDWALSNGEVYAEYVYSANRYVYQPTGKPVSTGSVQVIEKSLYVDGEPFQVRGVGYQPTPIGSWPSPEIYTNECILERDIPRLRDMGVNTIRLWAEPPPETLDPNGLLDRCYNGGDDPIYVIMGFWIPIKADYSDPSMIATTKARFWNYVTTFKDHPAVLAWGIGNENNLKYAGDPNEGDPSEWFALANILACDAYAAEGESYHPTMVINGDMTFFGDAYLGNGCRGSDDASMNFVDMWGHNAYPGEDYHCYFDYFDRLSAKPLIITEYGVDAYNAESQAEDQSMQAEYDVRQWRQLKTACVGGTIMEYSDEWWKAGDPNSHDTDGHYSRSQPDGVVNEEWWGLFAVARSDDDCDTVLPRTVVSDLTKEFVCPGADLDGDDDVDLADLAELLGCYGCREGDPCWDDCVNADFDDSGCVDLSDLAFLLGCYGYGTEP